MARTSSQQPRPDPAASPALPPRGAVQPTGKWVIILPTGDWFEGDSYYELVVALLGQEYGEADTEAQYQWRALQSDAVRMQAALAGLPPIPAEAIALEDPAGQDHERAFIESLARLGYLTLYENTRPRDPAGEPLP